jgi:hypothetical protein
MLSICESPGRAHSVFGLRRLGFATKPLTLNSNPKNTGPQRGTTSTRILRAPCSRVTLADTQLVDGRLSVGPHKTPEPLRLLLKHPRPSWCVLGWRMAQTRAQSRVADVVRVRMPPADARHMDLHKGHASTHGGAAHPRDACCPPPLFPRAATRDECLCVKDRPTSRDAVMRPSDAKSYGEQMRDSGAGFAAGSRRPEGVSTRSHTRACGAAARPPV